MPSKEERQKIGEEINRRIEETKQSIKSLTGQSKPVKPDNAIGRITRMDAIQQRSVCEANLRSAKEKLYSMEEALAKLDDPSFGLCAGCGNAILLERILILPESRFCVSCASKS